MCDHWFRTVWVHYQVASCSACVLAIVPSSQVPYVLSRYFSDNFVQQLGIFGCSSCGLLQFAFYPVGFIFFAQFLNFCIICLIFCHELCLVFFCKQKPIFLHFYAFPFIDWLQCFVFWAPPLSGIASLTSNNFCCCLQVNFFMCCTVTHLYSAHRVFRLLSAENQFCHL